MHRNEASFWDDTPWRMTIDLKELAFSAGKIVEDKYDGGKVLDYPMARARKLLKIIAENAGPEDLEKCNFWFKKNEKLNKWWQKYNIKE